MIVNRVYSGSNTIHFHCAEDTLFSLNPEQELRVAVRYLFLFFRADRK